MSNAAKIQADYEQLGQIASQFAQQGDRTLALGRQVYNCMSELQNGGWIGVGAQRFYNEMDSLVLPGLERLMNALNTGAAQTERISPNFCARLRNRQGNSFTAVMRPIALVPLRVAQA